LNNRKELLFLIPLTILLLIPLLRGENYNIENIATTFISLLYHIQSLLNGEVPFWITKLGMGTTFPLAQDLSRYLPAYIMYLKPHEIFVTIYICAHIAVSWYCFYRVLEYYNFEKIKYIHTLIFTFYFSNFFITTLYVNWLIIYYLCAIWIPVIYWATINLKNKEFNVHSSALWSLIFLLCFYSIFIRLFILIIVFQIFCAAIIFDKMPSKKQLFRFSIFLVLIFLASLDRAYLFIEEALISGIPSSNAFATNKSFLSIFNQFTKPFFIPSSFDLAKYIKEFGEDGILKYILANITFTPSNTKFINVGLLLSVLGLVGAISLFKNNSRIFYLTLLSGLFFSFLATVPTYYLKIPTGNWLAEPFFHFFIIFVACFGLKYWQKNFSKKFQPILSILIAIHIFILTYTYLPIAYHLITDKEVFWFKYRTIVTDHTIPPYGLGYDYRNYGQDIFQKELNKVVDDKDRVIMTSNTRQVVRAESAFKRLQHAAFSQDEKKKLFNERWQYVVDQKDDMRCNFYRGATVIDKGVNVFNHYPKGKNLPEYIQDVQWPGIYLFRPENFFIYNHKLLELMGITTLVTPDSEIKDFSSAYYLERKVTCPFGNKSVGIMKSKNPLGMAYLSNGKIPKIIKYFKNCPYDIKLCYDVDIYRNFINDDLSSKIKFSSEVNRLKAVLPKSYPEDSLLHFANYYRPGWKAYNEYGQEMNVEKDYLGFTSVKLTGKTKSVVIVYRPMIKVILYYFYLSVILLLSIVVIYKNRFDK
jgi:hypothetical protein